MYAPVIAVVSRAAVGLQHVAVERDRAFAERGRSTQARRERPIRRWISIVRPPGRPRGFALRASLVGARQHAVFGRDPAFAFAAQERRHLVFDAGRAQHARVAAGYQNRTFGIGAL
jgi:hypothetical protein